MSTIIKCNAWCTEQKDGICQLKELTLEFDEDGMTTCNQGTFDPYKAQCGMCEHVGTNCDTCDIDGEKVNGCEDTCHNGEFSSSN
jgi:hypothetical protein